MKKDLCKKFGIQFGPGMGFIALVLWTQGAKPGFSDLVKVDGIDAGAPITGSTMPLNKSHGTLDTACEMFALHGMNKT